MTTFRIARHKFGKGDVVEVFEDGKFLGVIYPQDRGVMIVALGLVDRFVEEPYLDGSHLHVQMVGAPHL